VLEFDFPGALHCIIIGENKYAYTKWNEGHVLAGNPTPNRIGIEVKELTDHPIPIGANPKSDGHIMRQEITIEIMRVGRNMARPSSLQNIHQLISFTNQKSMCVFSIWR
jgi:hypothetical protein